jgi:prepilin-type N-terminal cleavage/methylation domain-containing protein
MSQARQFINGKRGAKGFTLVEVLVSMAIMTVGLLGVAALIGSTLASGTQARYMNIANILASEKLDNLNKWPSNDPNVAPGGALAGPPACAAAPTATR